MSGNGSQCLILMWKVEKGLHCPGVVYTTAQMWQMWLEKSRLISDDIANRMNNNILGT